GMMRAELKKALYAAAAFTLLQGTAIAQENPSASASDADMPAPAGASMPANSAPPLTIAAAEPGLVTAPPPDEAGHCVPLGLAVLPVEELDLTGTYNLGQLSQLVPTVQFFSSNPRNTAITIRGLGTSFGLTNDGLESGVGLYIDQVYMSRPAAATFDF